MQFLATYKHVIALTSEAADNPMGASANPGPNGEYAKNRGVFLERAGIRPDELALAGLVHGPRVAYVSFPPPGGCVPEVDGLVTRISQALAVMTADCYPVFATNMNIGDGRMVGIAHAGWPGIVGVEETDPESFVEVMPIVHGLASAFRDRGVDPRDNLAVAIGPGIGKCCFVVRDDARGVSHYRERGYETFVTEVGEDDLGKRFSVDLLGILLHQLTEELGVPRARIECDLTLCTSCTRDADGQRPRFLSWRRDGMKGANMLSVIRPRFSQYGIETYRLE